MRTVANSFTKRGIGATIDTIRHLLLSYASNESDPMVTAINRKLADSIQLANAERYAALAKLWNDRMVNDSR